MVLLLGLGFGVIVALALGRFQPRTIDEPPAPASDLVAFGPNERVVWIGEARVRWVIVLALGLMVLGAFQVVMLAPPTGEIVLASRCSLRASRRFTSSPIGAASAAVPPLVGLAWASRSIASLRRGDRRAAAAMGRVGLPRFAALVPARCMVVRGGPGLRLDLRDGKVFVVTVDDAEEAAAVVNGLLASPTSTSR